jgi:hypothetical protein
MAVVLAFGGVLLVQGAAQARAKHHVTTHHVVKRHRAHKLNFKHLTKIQRRLVSTPMQIALGATAHTSAVIGDGGGGPGDGLPADPPSSYSAAPSNAAFASAFSNYFPSTNRECSEVLFGNTKVNVNCLNLTDPDLLGRGQANNEEFIATDLYNPMHVVASDNNYVRGDGTCGAHYSLDGGNTWNDSTIPNGFSRGLGKFARQYWEAGGDTSVAWDTRGNAYESCQVFNRGAPTSQNPDQTSGFLVFRSTHNNGASWNFPGRYVTSWQDFTGLGNALEDKQLLTVDNHLSSPYRDRVYVSWTLFAPDGSAYIFESHSSDYGEHFSQPVLVSRDSSFCTNTFGAGTPNGRCNENQFSDPFTGPDGALYVVYSNFNNQPTAGTDNRYEVLMSKSTDGGNTFGPPVKVSDYYDLPDCDPYQGPGADPGRACVPEKGGSTKSVFRATNYASGAVDPTDASRIAITFGSYINRDSNESNGCVPAGFAPDGNPVYTGVKTPGACANKILVSISHDAGASFTGTAADPRTEPVVPQAPAQRHTDQWFQWEAFTRDGRFAVDYYDRQYGADEFTGSSDISLSGSRDLLDFGVKRITGSSMPAPTDFMGPKGGQFYGDYIGLSAVDQAYPIWSDTRSRTLILCPGSSSGPGDPPQLCTATMSNGEQANDEDSFMDRTGVPMGTTGSR